MPRASRALALLGMALLLGTSAQALSARSAEAAAAVASTVLVRAGRHQGFERLVLDWPTRARAEVRREGDVLRLALSGESRVDVTGVDGRLGEHILSVEPAQAPGRTVLLVRVRPESQHRLSTLGDNRVILDVSGGRSEPQPAPATRVAARTPATAPVEPVATLQHELYRRDLMIASLLRRIERLERATPLPETPAEEIASAPPPAAERRVASADPRVAAVASAGPPAETPSQPPAPLPAERALERTLVRQGTLLLRPGELELEPGLAYTRRENDAPVFVTNGGAASVFVGENDVRRNEYLGSVDLRAGIPFDAQLELSLPYRVVNQSVVTDVGFDEADEADETGQGLGDLTLAAAKTLLRQKGWRPDLVARAWWDTRTGETQDDGVALAAGFDEIGFSLSALRRQDPLAFFAAVSYETALEKDDFDPGDEVGLSLGSALAVTPDTSIRLSFDQRFVDDASFGGRSINGSDETVATLSFDLGTVLTRRLLLNLGVDVGVSDDAPDYAARVSLPIRLDLPIL